ncbi:MAG: Ig-like domain-containing protein [Phycisphaerae bacterium]
MTNTRIATATGVILALGHAASGATFTVNSTADDGSNGTLRWAIDQANALGDADTISFSLPDPSTITLTSMLPAIAGDVEIDGPGAGALTISGASSFRIFAVTSGNVVIRDLTLADGRAAGGAGGISRYAGGGGGAPGVGGALFVVAGDVTVRDVTFSSNHAVGGAGGNSWTSNGADGGGGGGGVGGNGADGSGLSGGAGGSGGPFGTAGAAAGAAGAIGAGGGGGNDHNAGGAGGDYAGGGAGGAGASGGAGGYGGGGGGSGDIVGVGGAAGTFAGTGGTSGGPYGGGGGGGAGLGGAVFAHAGTIFLRACAFHSNTATAGAGGTSWNAGQYGTAGQAKGGAIFIAAGATARYVNLTFGTGGQANAAADAGSSDTDNVNLYGVMSLAFPLVDSITRTHAATTNAASVGFQVVFTDSVTGLDVADFAVTAGGGVTGAAVTNVSGSGATWTVTVGTGAGDGTIRLDFVDNDSVIGDASGEPAGGAGAGNATESGPSYTIDKTGPAIISVHVVDGLNIDVTFDEAPATGALDPSSYTISGAGKGALATHPNTVTDRGAGVYRLAWTTGEMKNGADVIIAATVADALGNPSGAAATHTSGGIGIGPTVTLATAAAAETSAAITVTATASEPAATVDPTRLFTTNATVSNFAGADTTWTFTLTPIAAGPFAVRWHSAGVIDAAGNPSHASNTLTGTFVVEPTPAPTPDPAPDPAPDPPAVAPDLVVQVTDATTRKEDGVAQFEVRVTNHGDGPAEQVIFSFELPKDSTLLAVRRLVADEAREVDLAFEQVASTVRVALGDIASDEQVTLFLEILPAVETQLTLEFAVEGANVSEADADSTTIVAGLAVAQATDAEDQSPSCDSLNILRWADCCGVIGVVPFSLLVMTLAGLRSARPMTRRR